MAKFPSIKYTEELKHSVCGQCRNFIIVIQFHFICSILCTVIKVFDIIFRDGFRDFAEHFVVALKQNVHGGFYMMGQQAPAELQLAGLGARRGVRPEGGPISFNKTKAVPPGSHHCSKHLISNILYWKANNILFAHELNISKSLLICDEIICEHVMLYFYFIVTDVIKNCWDCFKCTTICGMTKAQSVV